MVGCPTCGAELTFIEQYGRHYCYGCRSYAPRNLHACPECHRALVFVQQYERFYCYGCQTYRGDVDIRNPCPTCGDELDYLPQYDRFYCYACQEYAPRAYGLARASGRPRPMTDAGPPGNAIGYAPFSREELDLASKEQLIEWCKEYGLDHSGMKYELRLRLLEHVRKQGLLLRGEDPGESEPPPKPEAADEESSAEGAESPPEAEAPAAEGAGGGPSLEAVEEADVEEEGRTGPPPEGAPAPQARPQDRHESTACPRCGGELTFIPQYGRWYCYACRTYAPAETPRPASYPGSVPPGEQRAVKISHGAGGNPMVGISLALVGLSLFVVEMLLFRAPAVFDLPVLLTAPEIDFALQFLSVVFIALGLVAAVLLVRTRA